jgi:hypothetical protein
MQRHVALFGDAVTNRPFEFRSQRQHGADNFADGSKIIVGNPLAQPDQRLVKHGRGIEHADYVFGLNFGLVIVQSGDDSRHALLAEGHEHASTHNRLHPIGHNVGEDEIERHRQSYVAEFRHGKCRRERPRSCSAIR